MKNPRVLIGLAISLVCGYIAVRGVEWSAVWTAMTGVHLLTLIPAIGCLGLLFVLRAARWQRLVAPLHPLPLRPFFSATLIGFMANDLLPLRVGEFIRTYALTRMTPVRMSTALATAVLERLWDTVVISILLGCTLFIVPMPAWLVRASMVTLGSCVVLLIVGWWLARRAPGSGLSWLSPRLTTLVERFADGLRTLHSFSSVVGVLLLSFVLWLPLIAYYWLLLRACGFALPLGASLVVTVLTVLAAALPAAPGFVGTFQYAVVLALSFFSIPKEEALGFSIVAHVAQLLPVIVAGLIILACEDLPLWPSRLTPLSKDDLRVSQGADAQ